MKKWLLILGVLFSITCHAQGTLGTVTKAMLGGTGDCSGIAGNTIPNGVCWNLQVVCPNIATQSGIIAKVIPPSSGNVASTITTISGLGGGGLYEANWGSTGAGILTTLLADGFTVVELDWPAATFGMNGWFSGPGGSRAEACRPASILHYIYANLATNTYQCVTGTSGGAAAVAYSLDWYGLGSILNYALMTSGPPLSRYDLGCDNSMPSGNFNPVTGTTVGQQFSLTTIKIVGCPACVLTLGYNSTWQIGSNIAGVISGLSTTQGLLLNGQTVTVEQFMNNWDSMTNTGTFQGTVTGVSNVGTTNDTGTFTLNSSLTFVLADAKEIVDASYSYNGATPSPNFCQYSVTNSSSTFDGLYLYDSVMGPAANYSFTTPVYFEVGGEDYSNAPVQAGLFITKLGAGYHVCADGPHEIGSVSDCATFIINDLSGANSSVTPGCP